MAHLCKVETATTTHVDISKQARLRAQKCRGGGSLFTFSWATTVARSRTTNSRTPSARFIFRVPGIIIYYVMYEYFYYLDEGRWFHFQNALTSIVISHNIPIISYISHYTDNFIHRVENIIEETRHFNHHSFSCELWRRRRIATTVVRCSVG